MLVILRDAASGAWLHFREPVEVLVAYRLEEVKPDLQYIERRVQQEGLYAAGFLSYEAAPAFDPALRTRPARDFPFLCFGLYQQALPFPMPSTSSATYLLGEWSPSVNIEEYCQGVDRIKGLIARGETYQVNYTFRLRTVFRGDPWPFFLRLIQAQEAGYGAYVDTGRHVLCCASPELFFRVEGHQVIARPMKGTVGRGPTLTQDLKLAHWLSSSEKNRAENVMIVDMIRNDLGRIAKTGSVQVPSLWEIERYPTLWQMTSTIAAQSEAPLTEIMAALFPSASVTGAPKVRTMSIIADLESSPRYAYCGCIGFLAPARIAQFNVTIRTVWIDRECNRAEYGVGGGIVWDSKAEEEYTECQTKARLLTYTPPEFSLLEAILWTPEEGLFLIPYHFRRLHDSAAYFGYPLDLERARHRLDRLTATLPPVPHKIRLKLNRHGEIACEATPLRRIPKPARPRLRIASQPVDSRDIFLYHKTTHRAVYDEALRNHDDCDEVLLWNERQEVTETDSANLVVLLDGRLWTPPILCGLLGGTFRAWLLEQGQIAERIIYLDDLRRCEKIYLINSIRKWREAVLQV